MNGHRPGVLPWEEARQPSGAVALPVGGLMEEGRLEEALRLGLAGEHMVTEHTGQGRAAVEEEELHKDRLEVAVCYRHQGEAWMTLEAGWPLE